MTRLSFLGLLLAAALAQSPASPAAAPPLASLDAAATSALLGRLTLGAHPHRLEVEARESWTPAARIEPAEIETDRVVYYRSVPIEVEETMDQRRLSAAAARRQQQQLARQERAVDRAAAAAPEAAAAGRLLNLEGEIWTVSRFVAQFQWMAVAAGNGTVKLRFSPAAARRPATRLEHLLSRTAGSLTVDAATGQIEAGQFHSLGPVWFGAGLVAHFARFSGAFTLQPAGSGWVMRQVTVEVEGRELFHRIHGTETMIYSVREP